MMTEVKGSRSEHLVGMKGLSTDSIAIRFSASSVERQEEELSGLSSSPSRSTSTETLKFVMREDEPLTEPPLVPNHNRSSSAPVSEVSTPSVGELPAPPVSISNNLSVPAKLSDRGEEALASPSSKEEISFGGFERSSFISGIRERLQEPLSSIRDRIEVLKTESPLVESIERRLRKTDSLDSPVDSRNSRLRTQSKLSRTRHGSLDLEGPSPSSSLTNGTTSSVNDFDGIAEDNELTLTPKPVPKSLSSDSIDRSKLVPIPKKDINSPSDGAEARPMSLSNLLSKSESQQTIAEEATEFFDPDEQPSPPSSPSLPPAPPAGPLPSGPLPPTSSPTGSLITVPSATLKQRLIATLVAFIAYLVIPMPMFLSGMIAGAALASLALWIYFILHPNPSLKQEAWAPDLTPVPPLRVPEMKESTNADNKFKGWMNELSKYNVENYHISHTHSIFVTLEGKDLRLQTPKQNISRQALHDDSFAPHAFISQRFFDLSQCHVTLLPEGIIKKRLWSKKYPICITVTRARNDSADMNGVDETGKTATEPLTKLFLFARTCREKEEWFRRFYAISIGTNWPSRTSDLVLKIHDRFKPLTPDPPSAINDTEPFTQLTEQATLDDSLLEYLAYMAHVMPKGQQTSKEQINWNIDGLRRKQCEPQILWVNALISRLFWDFLREQYWRNKMREKLQKKLSKIHVPYFINELTVTGIELGSEVPFINRASKPYLDDRGLWVDLDILYQGGFHMILETKCNLMKLKKNVDVNEEDKAPPSASHRSAWTDSDEEDSAESSTDEEDDFNMSSEASADDRVAQGGGQRKLLRIVDRITQSKYFQQATEYKYIKKAMEGVSNTRLELRVELRRLCGTMAVNIPPPPSDRIWYGFRSPPHFNLSAVPKVGDREFNVSQITDWIEKKLTLEFQRVFVLPNMDDLVIPLMCDAQTNESA